METFILYSGWGMTFVATITALVQYFEKEKYKKEIANIKIVNQGDRHMTFGGNATSIENNMGKVDINHKHTV